MQPWKTELRTWANRVASDFAKRDDVLGVAIGGSIGRGQEWRHSDLELGVLLEEEDKSLPYFNVDSGRGLEAIQLVRENLEESLSRVESGDCAPLVRWPVQLWRCRIVHDPTGLLARCKKAFDDGLFRPEVLAGRISNLRTALRKKLDEARDLLAADRPAAALVRTRWAMNDAILALHWSCGELPRSQSRTDSRLRALCRKHSLPSFYALYREVFALDDTTRVVRKTWPLVKEQVLELACLWSDSARDFFVHAVDGDFQWRQNAGILTVYRLYVPTMGAPDRGVFNRLDDAEWARENRDLLVFLGLAHADKNAVSALVERVATSLDLDPALLHNTTRARQ
ncbi:hypothetical protein JW916_04675 [Candidatus Sumerlaeota bacterium]|nr:hypothetical protein [Candidatus Sumerlaeota bacterium]